MNAASFAPPVASRNALAESRNPFPSHNAGHADMPFADFVERAMTAPDEDAAAADLPAEQGTEHPESLPKSIKAKAGCGNGKPGASGKRVESVKITSASALQVAANAKPVNASETATVEDEAAVDEAADETGQGEANSESPINNILILASATCAVAAADAVVLPVLKGFTPEGGETPTTVSAVATESAPSVESTEENKQEPIAGKPAAKQTELATADPAKNAESKRPEKVGSPLEEMTLAPPAEMAEALESLENKGENAASPTASDLPTVPPQNTRNPAGTVAAQEDAPMKSAVKMEKAAGQSKDLPGGNLAGGREEFSEPSPEFRSSSVYSAKSDTFTVSTQLPVAPTALNTQAVETPAVNTAEVRASAVEQLQETITFHAVQLCESKDDSMRVVLHPGSGLQLALELRQHADAVEVQATVQAGDFQHLNSQWGELQRHLDGLGIRLAPLNGTQTGLNAGTNGFGRAPQNFGASEELAASAFAEFATAHPAALAATQPKVAVHRGWQSWA